MPSVTFQVLEGIDKGRTFRELTTPVTIGREEGNVLRLNDERVSRFHAKVQWDNNEVIITDLESTNGTRVNGAVVQIRRLKPGDRISVGRSLLLFGSEKEIRERQAALISGAGAIAPGQITTFNPATVPVREVMTAAEQDPQFELSLTEKVTMQGGALYQGSRALVPLPQKMTPSQAARLAEILDFLHRHLTAATEHIRPNDDASQVTLSYADWQRVMAVQMLLARYARAVSDPDAIDA